jgi:hypothetical protein
MRFSKQWIGALVFAAASNVAAAPPALHVGVEHFNWQEYDADGGRLLKESGPRFFVGLGWETPATTDVNVTLQFQGALYFGRVDYDGQACTLSGSCTPFATDTYYTGARGEAILARRLGATGGPEVFGGGGFDTWSRDIEGHSAVRGVTEDWTVLYVVGGAGYRWLTDGQAINVRAGLKYPFYVYEVPDSYDVTLNPKGTGSFFFRLSTDVLRAGSPVWGFGLYYDSYRFNKSDREASGSVLIWQPESHQDAIGLFATVYF